MVTTDQQYSYELLLSDIESLQKDFPGYFQRSGLGLSVLGRDMPLLTIGNPQRASTIIWVDASIHAREYMTSQIVMLSFQYLLEQLDSKPASASGESSSFRWENGIMQPAIPVSQTMQLNSSAVCFYIAPMLNPDGVNLSRFGLDSVSEQWRHKELIAMNNGSRDFTYWKANINGVDLNSNFPAYWKEKDTGVYKPGPSGYKGTAPLSQPETKHVAFFLRRRMEKSISYHAQGAEIYWYFRQEEPLLRENLQFAETLEGLTRYRLMPKSESLSGAGLRDYQIDQFKRSALTVEIGPVTGPAPMPLRDLNTINRRNRTTLHYLWTHP